MGFEIEPTSRYAQKAMASADGMGLGFKVYSYSAILGTVPDGDDFIARCAEVTGTDYNEQLKFALASDVSLSLEDREYGHPAVGVVRYRDKIHFGNMAQVLIDRGIYPELRRGKFSPRKADPRVLGIDPGYIGINQNAQCPVTGIAVDMGDRREWVPVPYVFDNPIRDLGTVCFPTGKGKADELVVVSAGTAFGERLDDFLRRFIGEKAFLFGDIRKG